MKLISKEGDQNVLIQIEKRTSKVFYGISLFLLAYLVKLAQGSFTSEPAVSKVCTLLIVLAICYGLYLVIFTATRTLELDSASGKLIYTVRRLLSTKRAEFESGSIASVNISYTFGGKIIKMVYGENVRSSRTLAALLMFTDGTILELKKLNDPAEFTKTVLLPRSNGSLFRKKESPSLLLFGGVLTAVAELSSALHVLTFLAKKLNVPFTSVVE